MTTEDDEDDDQEISVEGASSSCTPGSTIKSNMLTVDELDETVKSTLSKGQSKRNSIRIWSCFIIGRTRASQFSCGRVLNSITRSK